MEWNVVDAGQNPLICGPKKDRSNIPAGKEKRILAVAVWENEWEPLKLGLISG